MMLEIFFLILLSDSITSHISYIFSHHHIPLDAMYIATFFF